MKKKCANLSNRNLFNQTLRRMKTTILLLCFAVAASLASETYSQSTKLTVVLNNTSVEDVLRAIEDQSEFRFFYSGAINVNRKVDVDIQDKPVFDVLDDVLKGTDIKYEVIGRQVALYNDANRTATMTMMQQSKTVRGKVTSVDGESLPGVTVTVRGTSIGAITDADGNYSLNVPAQGTTLVFSFIGMETRSIEIGNQSQINVVMSTATIGLEEVVAIGYGTVRKSDVTGAVARISEETLKERPVANVLQAMQGKAAGVDINANIKPGELPQIIIRGNRSITASNTPLYVVDGIPFDAGTMADLNPNDIASVEVLKDASATAIYGSRGANGVVLIQQKKVKKAKLQSVTMEQYRSIHTNRSPTGWMVANTSTAGVWL